jgi:hypothetical protein
MDGRFSSSKLNLFKVCGKKFFGGGRVWGVGCRVWGVGRINRNNLLSPVSYLLPPVSRLLIAKKLRQIPEK